MPAVTTDTHFRMVVTMMERDNYLGRLVTGRVASGSVKVGDRLKALQRASSGAAGTPPADVRSAAALLRRSARHTATRPGFRLGLCQVEKRFLHCLP